MGQARKLGVVRLIERGSRIGRGNKTHADSGGLLEAELTGRSAGLVKLAVGTKLNNVVAGEGFEPPTFGL